MSPAGPRSRARDAHGSNCFQPLPDCVPSGAMNAPSGGYLVSNDPSIGFRRSLGAEPVEEWTDFRMSGEPLRKLADGNAGSSLRIRGLQPLATVGAHMFTMGDN